MGKLLETRNLYYLLLFPLLTFYTVISDSDYFFHLAAGEYILSHLSLPHVDPFSYTMAGQPWVMHEWLFEVIIYRVHETLGTLGVAAFTSAMASTTIFILVRSCRTRHLAAELVAALVITILVFAFFVPRPHIFSYLFLALFIHGIVRLQHDGYPSTLKWFPAIMIIWVNTHGGYIVGIVTLTLALGSELILRLQHGTRHSEDTRLKAIAFTLLTTTLASTINPYFITHLLFPFQLMGQEAVLTVYEWNRPDFNRPVLQLYLLFYLIFAVTCIATATRPRPADLITPFAFIALGLSAVRHLPLAVIAVAPYLLQRLSPLPDSNPPDTTRVPDGGQPGLSPLVERGLNALVIGTTLFVLTSHYSARHQDDAQALNRHLPVRASDFIVEAGLRGNMFNPYQSGGYLIYKLYPAHKVFIDIRADMYGEAIMRDYLTIRNAEAGWERLLEGYAVNYILCKGDEPLRGALEEANDFILIYDDHDFSVFIRNTEANRDVTERYRINT